MFWFRFGPSEDDIVSIREVQSMIPSQQRRGLLRRLVLVISPVEKPQFQDSMCMPMSRKDRSWTCNGWEDTIELKYEGGLVYNIL